MNLWQVRGRHYSLHDNAQIFGVALGSYGPGQTCFIVPIKGQDQEVREDHWGVGPSRNGKPMLIANVDPNPGVILKLSSFNRMGKAVGTIYAIDEGNLGNIVAVGYGIGGPPNGDVTWEEALVVVRGTAAFYIAQVGPPDAIVMIDGKEVTFIEAAERELESYIEGELIRIDDPRITRWRAQP